MENNIDKALFIVIKTYMIKLTKAIRYIFPVLSQGIFQLVRLNMFLYLVQGELIVLLIKGFLVGTLQY